MADIVILHGTLGSPNGNWFPWLRHECTALGHQLYVPEFPTPEGQNVEQWCAALRDQAPVFGPDTVIIGHSIGATFLLHILATLQTSLKASIFIAPVMDLIGNPEYDRLNASFIALQWDWQDLRQKLGQAMIMHGDDDPYVPLIQAQILGQGLAVPVEIVKQGGHLNAESGYTTFPDLLAKLQTYL